MKDSVPVLPNLYFAKSGKYTYARTYRNVWAPKKNGTGKAAVKRDIKKVGRIDNSDGIGVINFDKDFYELHPEFKNYIVTRMVGEDDKKFVLQIRRKDNNEALKEDFIKAQSIGASTVIQKLVERIPLLKSLKATFPDSWELILSFAIYMVMEPDAKAERFSIFAQEVKLPYKGNIYPSKVTRLLQSITDSEIKEFFQDYLRRLTTGKHLSTQRFWAIDSTSISTYAKLLEAKYGKNKQDEDLPQLNVMYLTDAESGLPLFYQHFNGSIPDMASCVSVFEMLLNLGAHSFVAVADRGFFSESNMKMIMDKGYHFVMCVPFERCSSYQKAINEAQLAMTRDNLYSLRCDQEIYTCKERITIGKRKAYVHVFFNKRAAGDQASYYQKRLKQVEKDYLECKTLTPENVQFMLNNFVHDENGVFQVVDKRLVLNKAVFQQTINNCGIFLTISDSVKHAEIAFLAYKARQRIEDNFKYLKDRMKMRRLRVSTEESLDGKCFIQFLATTIYSLLEGELLRVKRSKNYTPSMLPHHSVGSILDELRGIRETFFSKNNAYVVNPISKKQRDCLALFRVKQPVSHYEEGLTHVNEVTDAPKPHGDGLK